MRCLILITLFVSPGCQSSSSPEASPDARIATVESFRAARDRGELDAARALLADDPRMWFGTREGAGSAWKLGGGRWADWDEHFRGKAERVTPWQVEGPRVWADMLENNDYYRLTESPARTWRGTYFLDGSGRIEGFLVSSLPSSSPDQRRDEEFEAWARTTRPDEAEYLMPGGSIDPTGDRPVRMRALLDEWRADVGLPAIE